ncbi:VapC toxin family PIN domain ribonuclease [Caulobacter zeae]|uniref:Ribonuclease VapC n=1 Tax=Caulobacter zeae TaxID=2055137 RepID=A0A2N5D842_9CAUL|nr:type II toxin-antitoxin system VapC family toxin [Caulobacter zeae]PLR22234.1 VapC toxin family PIN domain ribonuclease [Caulobacter zeae]
MFVDASAWRAILLAEAESEVFMAKLADAPVVLTSAIAGWETVRAVARATSRSQYEAADRLDELQRSAGVRLVPLGQAEQALALEAHARFGKGVHPAKLNMGDCFSYACAKAHDVPLLYKGGDFALTDIEAA